MIYFAGPSEAVKQVRVKLTPPVLWREKRPPCGIGLMIKEVLKELDFFVTGGVDRTHLHFFSTNNGRKMLCLAIITKKFIQPYGNFFHIFR